MGILSEIASNARSPNVFVGLFVTFRSDERKDEQEEEKRKKKERAATESRKKEPQRKSQGEMMTRQV